MHFGGRIAALTLVRRALDADEIKTLNQHRADFSLVEFEEGSKSWPVQTRAQAGYRAPQDAPLMPTSKAPFSRPVARTAQFSQAPAVLQESGNSTWTLASGWTLAAAPDVSAGGSEIAQPGFSTRNWMQATIPGTVLTTMIDRGIYPDPDYGLNNLAIPEALNKQDYWYRTEFKAPPTTPGRRLTLTFQGINYAADGVAEWTIARQCQRRLHPRCLRCHPRSKTRPNQRRRGARLPSAAPRNPPRAIH